jgi:hypothetical protein
MTSKIQEYVQFQIPQLNRGKELTSVVAERREGEKESDISVAATATKQAHCSTSRRY